MSIKKISQNIKKRIPIFYKIAIFLSLTVFTILFYFIVLVSAQPRSIPFITIKIQQYLDKNFLGKVKIKETSIGFTKYGTLKISLSGLQILQDTFSPSVFGDISSKKKFLLMKKAETELSLLDLLLFKINISKLTINKPEFIIDTKKSANVGDNNQFLTTFYQLFSNSSQPIKEIEIKDGEIIIIHNNASYRFSKLNSTLQITIKNQQIILNNKNSLSFNVNKSSFYLDNLCVLKSQSSIKCESKIKNLNTNHLPNFLPNLPIPNNLNGIAYGNIIFAYSLGILPSVEFDVKIDYGNFTHKKLFSENINFRNLNAKFILDLENQNIVFNNIEAELINKISDDKQKLNAKIKAEINIEKQPNNNYQSLFNIDVVDLKIDELAIFWPLVLNQNNVRTWFLEHFKDGKVTAKANLALLHTPNKTSLQNIDAWVNFADTNLKYHPNFPEIRNAYGLATFSKKNMMINIDEANVLNSKISKAKVIIPDFANPKYLLQISGEIFGDASELLKPISNSDSFYSKAKQYLNGNAVSVLFLELPLHKEKFDLPDVFLSVNTKASQVKNKFLEGEANIKVEKPLNSNSFNIDIDLEKTKLILENLALNKKLGEKANLNFTIAVSNDININNIELKTILGKKKLKGEMQFSYQPFFIKNIYFNNQNFAKQNYSFSYQQKDTSAPRFIKLTGKYFNISEFLNNNAEFFKDNQSNKNNFKISVSLQKFELFNKKIINNFVADASCMGWYCDYLNIKAENPNNKKIVVKSENFNQQENIIKITIEDIAYLADIFMKNNQLAEGGVLLEIRQKKSEDGLNLSGNLSNIGNISIFENEKIKKLANDQLKSQIKDKVFKNSKTTFSNVKANFDLRKNNLVINSFLANNFAIGITSKGNIDLLNQEMQLKGLLIPAYVVNNLFGLGKVPILGNIFKELLIGNDSGGVFGIRYQYVKNKNNPQGKLEVSKISAFVPTTIQNLFD